MKYRKLVPSLHSKSLNPNIDFESSAFQVQQEVSDWKRPVLGEGSEATEYPRRAGVSSFGAGGANAHILIEEYIPESEAHSDHDTPQRLQNDEKVLIVLSARTTKQLKAKATQLQDWISETADGSEKQLLEVAYTLQVGREPLKERLAIEVASFAQLSEKLSRYFADESEIDGLWTGQAQDRTELLEPEAIIKRQEQNLNWIEKRQYQQLMNFWLTGGELSWNLLYTRGEEDETLPHKISLPTYPFARERYWFAEKNPVISEINVPSSEPVEMLSAAPPVVEDQPAPTTGKSVNGIDEELLLEKTLLKLKSVFSSIVKFSVDDIDETELLENYGIDSVMIVELNEKLSTIFGELPATLFYEYLTLDAMASYMIEDHRGQCITWTGLSVAEEVEIEEKKEIITPKSVATPLANRQINAIKVGEAKGGTDVKQEPIAIIGVTGRYAQSKDINEYWENLKAGKDCITEIPKDRWGLEDFFMQDRDKAATQGKSYGKWGSFIDGYADFDPQFFNMTPKEAIGMDPHTRLFIESSWQVLESAGYTKERLKEVYNGNVGVFAGITRGGFAFYAEQLMESGQYPLNTMSAVANRTSYYLNLRGPSVPVDTMCSSSLTAIHEACESLLKGGCEMAIAGGVNLLLHPKEYVILSANNFLSTDGRCRSFGAGGDGYVPGEGVGTVLLKPLSKAQADGDHIHAIIRGTSVNHGGKTNGYTVPNPVAQGELVRDALDNAGVNAREVSYIEAHGTGTPLGDPIEITGLTQAFRADTKDQQYCAIGSAKSNMGHLEAAAGIAGVTKILMQMKHKMHVPSLHSEELNPNINFEKSPFYVQKDLVEWRRPAVIVNGSEREVPRIAGISSFGAGGSNAHVVLEEYDVALEDLSGEDPSADCPAMIVLSARNEDRLRAQASQLLDAIDQHQYTTAELSDMAFTLQLGREAMPERLGVLADSIEELKDKFTAYLADDKSTENLFAGNIKAHKTTLSLIDSDMQATIEKWIADKKYSKLLNLWTKGLSVDWKQLYRKEDGAYNFGKILSLPTYPFNKRKYWVGDAMAKENATNVIKPVQASVSKDASVMAPAKADRKNREEEPFNMMTFEETWQRTAISSTNTKIDTIACFLSDSGNQQVLSSSLKEYNQELKLIFISQNGGTDNANTYILQDKSDRNEIRSILDRITSDHGSVDALLYMWPLENAADIRNYETPVALLQAVGSGKNKVKNLVLAGQWQQQTGQLNLDRCYLESWIGFERTLKLILPQVRLSTIFQEVQAAQADIRDWSEKLWAELGVSDARSILYRGADRYIHQITSTTLEQTDNILKQNGTYLITGGLGSLGMLFASHLADCYNAQLILTGRSPLNADKESKIAQLEQLGGTVIYLQTDICDATVMRQELDEAKAQFGSIDGVLHTAGVIGAESLLDKTQEGFQKILAPKVDGTIVLDELLKDEALDFICYFSSSSAVIGDFGACDYSVANRFQMAFAEARNHTKNGRHSKAIAINWPLWKEGGMDLDSDQSTNMYLKSSGQRYLMREEGIAIFEKILQQQKTQHLVFVGQESKVTRFLGMQDSKAKEPTVANATNTLKSASSARRSEMEGMTIAECLEWDLVDIVSRSQEIPKEDLYLDENFADLGFDSISLTDLARALSQHYDLDIPPAIFFGYPTVEKLKDYFEEEHQEVINALYDEKQIVELEDPIIAEAPSEAATPTVPTQSEVKDIPVTDAGQTQATPGKEPIAIIGMSGLFPEARDVDEMWKILANGENVVKEIPKERFDIGQYFSEDPSEMDKTICKWSGLVPGVSEFDPSFFGISPRDAEDMDPRQRLLLQEAWKALEDAGYGPDKLDKSTISLYVGAEEGDYGSLTGRAGKLTSNHNAILSARLSYFLNFSGPNMAINTACSSGLVAAHQAFQSLQNEECDTAIAAGVNLMVLPELYVGMSQAGMLSSDGKCHTFDKKANGMVPGEAVAVVVLKKLSKAIADGDAIYATIEASGVNYDGKTNGITAPSGVSQSALFNSVYDRFKINPENIEYIVTHGTGTPLGDPVEINALHSAFKTRTKEKNFCALTSTKTNFGHTFAASGLVSLISLVQALRHQTIPASLHCTEESDYIQWKESAFFVNKTALPWQPVSDKQRLGAVSAFGMSGTNAHMVLKGYDSKRQVRSEEPSATILTISAKTWS
ncbi:MAG: SDR family NAD(P)-dependent oxidoreductase, partial [Bacteroidota bacterium]